MTVSKEKRIFWLGMHVVLTKTELPHLRKLGFEVFNPPYHSNIYDQSANISWDKEQSSSLPPEVFKELSEYNFFYNRISPRIAEILNEYFGTVIVTINPDWLQEILKVYHGKLIYRVYGQLGTVSEALWHRNCFRLIQERDDFWFVPHAEETAWEEHDWLKERMRVVPYTLPLDVFDYRDTWKQQEQHEPEIMVSCPNIDNRFYAGYYKYLNTNFPEEYLRLYGVQPRPMSDPRIVGTLPREELIQAYQKSTGYFYHYKESNVCYLPPIEMMIVGGPVIYLPGSLLAKYFQVTSPGLALEEEEAKQKMKWLLAEDQAFTEDVIASQQDIRLKYAPEYVNPIFEETFRELLNSEVRAPANPVVLNHQEQISSLSRVYLLFHFPGQIIQFTNRQYLSAEGIPRVMRKLVEAILAKSDHQVVITCYRDQLPYVFGFFDAKNNSQRIRFLVLDTESLEPKYQRSLVSKSITKIAHQYQAYTDVFGSLVSNLALFLSARLNSKETLQKLLLLPSKLIVSTALILFLIFLPLIFLTIQALKIPLKVLIKLRPTGNLPILCNKVINKLNKIIQPYTKLRYTNQINLDTNKSVVIVPHYYLFPESVLVEKELILYLPDYTPHFFSESFEGRKDGMNAEIGKVIAKLAKSIFTNSYYSKSYLPETILQVDASKIEVFPLPLLAPKEHSLAPIQLAELKKYIGDSPYIFYPTQNRPNKKLSFLLDVFEKVQYKKPELKLVLTCCLDNYQPVKKRYEKLANPDSVILFHYLSDSQLSWLYQHASALCFTSTMEGNFPPQVFEAVSHHTPVVASKIPLILEMLEEVADHLLLCEPLNREDFTSKLVYALENPEEIRLEQDKVLAKLRERCSDERFALSVVSFLNNTMS